MRVVVHLSDLHLGRADPQLLEPLVETVAAFRPHLVAVSGDLTQRALPHEFQQARALLDRLPSPQIVVPGNHDVPLYNLLARLRTPLANYRRYISQDIEPFFLDEELAVAGVNTARSLTWKGGRINQRQVARAYERLCVLHDDMTKIIVTHHPFELPEGHNTRDLVGRARMAMGKLALCGADVFLAGHLHRSYTAHTAERYRIAGHSALVIQAGTAISTRGRGEKNSFNVLHIEHPRVVVERLESRLGETAGGRTSEFVAAELRRFRHTPEGWVRDES
jgi:3',5'-cyclic AMP phosphodiesterase CpdA